MKGLREYIEAHGKHFTVELALKACNIKWEAGNISKATQSKVYYNVIGATLGDMLYLTNVYHINTDSSFRDCINYTINIISDHHYYDGKIFTDWLSKIVASGGDLDFTIYI